MGSAVAQRYREVTQTSIDPKQAQERPVVLFFFCHPVNSWAELIAKALLHLCQARVTLRLSSAHTRRPRPESVKKGRNIARGEAPS